MAEPKRAEILIEPDEYLRLESISRRRGVTVADLIHQAIADRYLGGGENRRQAAARLLSLQVPIDWGDWEDVEEELNAARAADALP
jgi:hypothetical protein